MINSLYHIPINYIKMVAEKKTRGLLLYGESSLGKSYRVKEVLQDLGIKDYHFIAGHITPMQFYYKLYEARDSLVIFDDVNILESKINLNMLKSALNENSNNVVEYHTTKPMNIPSSFVFNGQVIILLNELPRQSEHLKAIESRLITYNLKFTRQEILQIIFEIAQKEVVGTSLGERLMIAEWLRDNTSEATRNLNLRLFLQAIEFFKFDRANWKELAFKQVQNDEYTSYILQGLSEGEFIEKTGLHRATYYRYKQRVKQNERI